MFDVGVRGGVLYGVREILQHENRFGAAILELMLHFARRVQRIEVHHHIAGTQNCGDRNRILQDVRHHDGDACALL